MTRNKKIVTWVVGAIVGVIVLVFGAVLVYVKLIKDDAPSEVRRVVARLRARAPPRRLGDR